MGDNFLALFRVYDCKGNALMLVEAKNEYAAIGAARKQGQAASMADIFRIVRLY